jgi:hypothetical protein
MKNKETMIFLSAACLEEQAAARITAERPVAFGRYPRARACGGVGRRVSHQDERRTCRGDQGERSSRGAERCRLRDGSLGARPRCEAG